MRQAIIKLARFFRRPICEVEKFPSSEFAWWEAISRSDPLPDEWLATGQICCTIANSVRTKGRPWEPQDFMPRRKKKKQTQAELDAAISMTMSNWGVTKRKTTNAS
jgi:hypothetical protein